MSSHSRCCFTVHRYGFSYHTEQDSNNQELFVSLLSSDELSEQVDKNGRQWFLGGEGLKYRDVLSKIDTLSCATWKFAHRG